MEEAVPAKKFPKEGTKCFLTKLFFCLIKDFSVYLIVYQMLINTVQLFHAQYCTVNCTVVLS
jgi:hypothetical protein